jgi:release factor glutamine methyltransferase
MLKRPFLLRRVRRHVLERVAGVPIMVFPEVLNPVVFRSGAWLARVLADHRFDHPSGDAPRALDMGTGSGVGAVFAARCGYHVVAVDLNPEAVRCAQVNALMNGLEERVEVRLGDLFAPVAGEKFDLVLFNPPFFRGTPKDLLDLAWCSVDVLERFAAGLPSALAPAGQAWIVLSTDGEAPALLQALEQKGLSVRVIARKNLGNEIMTVYCAELA